MTYIAHKIKNSLTTCVIELHLLVFTSAVVSYMTRNSWAACAVYN